MTSSMTSSAFSRRVVPFANAADRCLVFDPGYAWRKVVTEKLESFIQLPAGWDGYSGVPVSLAVANFALNMLDVVADGRRYPPGSAGASRRCADRVAYA